MTKKKSSEILGMKMVCKSFSRPPKLGARFPPMNRGQIAELNIL